MIIDIKTGKEIMSEDEYIERKNYKFIAKGKGKTKNIPFWRVSEVIRRLGWSSDKVKSDEQMVMNKFIEAEKMYNNTLHKS